MYTGTHLVASVEWGIHGLRILMNSFDLRCQKVTYYINHCLSTNHICDRACENQPCERKLHRVICLPLSSALKVTYQFHKFQKNAH